MEAPWLRRLKDAIGTQKARITSHVVKGETEGRQLVEKIHLVRPRRKLISVSINSPGARYKAQDKRSQIS